MTKSFELVGEVHRFNTGRLYAVNGQEITWGVIDVYVEHRISERVVAFIDHARGIDGVIDLHFGNLDLIDDRWVLRAYDDHHYHHGYEVLDCLREAARG